MRQRLLALAATLSALGAGSIVFLRWETAAVDPSLDRFGAFEVLDRSSCTTSACNAGPCVQATNTLSDAGSACVPRFADCDFRIGQRVRDFASDAGVTLGPAKYQRLRLVALRCPGADGGVAFGVPFDDAGWPVYGALTATARCVRAPFDGGLGCQRNGTLLDGGTAYFGAGNVFPASLAVGANCEPVQCSVMFGDNPDTDL